MKYREIYAAIGKADRMGCPEGSAFLKAQCDAA